jgi:hypothetical protein
MHGRGQIPFVVLALAAGGCAHTMIEGTQIPDTDDNRALVQILAEVCEAMEARDADRILAHVSEDYFEDGGTPKPDDDYGYKELVSSVLPESLSHTTEVHLTMQVHEVVVEGDRARADIRYDSRVHLDMPSGALWDSHKEFNRVEFAREDGAWRIVSGL